jgi:hypothetical protein
MRSGYYTGGDVIFVENIRCGQALLLVSPSYKRIEAGARRGVADHSRFRLGAFRCRYSQAGPEILKTCLARRKFFSFV